jgi:hypothetical protein
MRRYDENCAAGSGHAMKFLDSRDGVLDVLDQMNGAHFVERVLAKRQAASIEIAQHIRRSFRVYVHADCAGIF